MAGRRKRGRRSSLQSASFQDLRAELSRRQRVLEDLYSQYRKIVVSAHAVAEQIRENGGEIPTAARNGRASTAAARVPGRKRATTKRRAGGGARRRPKNDLSLIDALSKVLKNKTLSVTEAAEAVQEAGYKTTSPNFRTIVNQALLRDDLFEKVSRGQYTAR